MKALFVNNWGWFKGCLWEDLQSLNIPELLDLIETSLRTIDKKLQEYDGLDYLKFMEMDDKHSIIKRLADLSDEMHGIKDEQDNACDMLPTNLFPKVFNDNILDEVYDLDTWAERIHLLQALSSTGE